MHICINKLPIIGQCQAIIWTNADISLIQTLGIRHEGVGWPAPAWAPGLTQREPYIIFGKTIPLQKFWRGSSCQAVDNLMIVLALCDFLNISGYL